jgi:hypothetical protein
MIVRYKSMFTNFLFSFKLNITFLIDKCLVNTDKKKLFIVDTFR